MKIINAKGLVRFAASGGHPEKEGFLLKRGEMNRGFQRRWFALKGNLLFYYDKRGDKEPAGVIVLEGCTIEVADCEDVDNYAFQITFPNSAMRTFILSADSQEELEAWMRALSCAPYDYVKLIVAELQNQLEDLASAADNARSIEATEMENRQTSEETNPATKIVRSSPPVKAGRVNPFNDDSDNVGDEYDAFRDRPSSSSLNVATWQMLGMSSFREMHAEIARQVKEFSSLVTLTKKSSGNAREVPSS